MSAAEPYTYVGEELDLFRHAHNWKTYFGRRLQPYLGGDVLEVGAGIGATTRVLCRGSVTSWTCLEPDTALARRLAEVLADSSELAVQPEVVVDALSGWCDERRFDVVLYIDVLEHIADDGAELAAAARRLRPGGRIVVLAPAHQFLFSPFDRSIGHYRRYDRSMFHRLQPVGCELIRAFYLDSCGLLASLGNRLFLRSGMPTVRQIRFWDRVLVRASRVVDPLCGYQMGKSVVGVWRRAPAEPRREVR
jgi:SAM-dependent methyltransferase